MCVCVCVCVCVYLVTPLAGITVKQYIGRTFSRPLVDLRATELGRMSRSIQRDDNDIPADGPTFDGKVIEAARWSAHESLADLWPEFLEISAFKLADEHRNALVVRVYNPTTQSVDSARISLRLAPLTIASAWRTRHDEEEPWTSLAVDRFDWGQLDAMQFGDHTNSSNTKQFDTEQNQFHRFSHSHPNSTNKLTESVNFELGTKQIATILFKFVEQMN